MLVSEVWTVRTSTNVGEGAGGPSGLVRNDFLGSSEKEGVVEGSVIQGNWVGRRASFDGLAHGPRVGGAVCEGGGSDEQGNLVGGGGGNAVGGEGGLGSLMEWSRQMSGSSRSSTPWTGSTPPASGSSGRFFSPFLLVLQFNLNFFAGVMHSMSVLVCEASPLEATPPPRWGWW